MTFRGLCDPAFYQLWWLKHNLQENSMKFSASIRKNVEKVCGVSVFLAHSTDAVRLKHWVGAKVTSMDFLVRCEPRPSISKLYSIKTHSIHWLLIWQKIQSLSYHLAYQFARSVRKLGMGRRFPAWGYGNSPFLLQPTAHDKDEPFIIAGAWEMHIWIRHPLPSWKPGAPTRWKELGTVISLVVSRVAGKPPYGSIAQCCYQRGSTTQSLPNHHSFRGGKSFVPPFSELAMGWKWLKNNSRNAFFLARFVLSHFSVWLQIAARSG